MGKLIELKLAKSSMSPVYLDDSLRLENLNKWYIESAGMPVNSCLVVILSHLWFAFI